MHTFDLTVPSKLEIGTTTVLRHEQCDEVIHGDKMNMSMTIQLVRRLCYLHAVDNMGRYQKEAALRVLMCDQPQVRVMVVQGQRP